MSFGLLFKSFTHSMNRFDTGELTSLGEKVLNLISIILLWPIFYPISIWGGKSMDRIFGGLYGYIPLIINSFIWAVGIYWILELFKKHNYASKQTAGTRSA